MRSHPVKGGGREVRIGQDQVRDKPERCMRKRASKETWRRRSPE